MTKTAKVVQALYAGLDRVTRLFWFSAGALITVMAFVTGYGVFTRYVLRNPDPYTYEIDSILMVACVLFAIAYTQKLGRHLRIDLLDKYYSATAKEILLEVISPLIGLTFCVVLTWKTADSALNALQNSEITRSTWIIPTFPIRLLIPIGTGLLCLILISQILRYAASRYRKNVIGQRTR